MRLIIKCIRLICLLMIYRCQETYHRSPLFDVMLISQTPADDKTNSSVGLKMEVINFEYPISKFDLSISYYEDKDSIKYYFEYNTSLFKKERIKNMFNHFEYLIKSVLEDDKKNCFEIKYCFSN